MKKAILFLLFAGIIANFAANASGSNRKQTVTVIGYSHCEKIVSAIDSTGHIWEWYASEVDLGSTYTITINDNDTPYDYTDDVVISAHRG